MPLLQVVCAALYILRNNLSRLFYYILLGIHSPSLDFIIMLSNPLLIFQGIKGVYAILKGVISIYWNISSGTVLYMGQQISKPTRQKISDNNIKGLLQGLSVLSFNLMCYNRNIRCNNKT
jgi:hypothetical protein